MKITEFLDMYFWITRHQPTEYLGKDPHQVSGWRWQALDWKVTRQENLIWYSNHLWMVPAGCYVEYNTLEISGDSFLVQAHCCKGFFLKYLLWRDQSRKSVIVRRTLAPPEPDPHLYHIQMLGDLDEWQQATALKDLMHHG